MLGRGSGGAANPQVSPASVARLAAHPALSGHPARPETDPSRQPPTRPCHRAATLTKSYPGAISDRTERNGASGVEAEAPCTAVESTRLPSGIVSRPGAPVKNEQPFTEPPFIFFKVEDPAFCPLMLGAPLTQKGAAVHPVSSGLGEEAGWKPAKISPSAPRPPLGSLRRPDVHTLSGVEADDDGRVSAPA